MSNSFKYDSYGNSIEGTDYCSGVETFAQNLIENNSNDASIIFPSSNGWMNPRSSSYKLDTSNCELILPQNIYKLKKVLIHPMYFDVKVHLNSTDTVFLKLNDLKDKNDISVKEANIINYVVEQTVYHTLPSTKSGGINKGNVFYYTQGDNKINFGENTRKILGFDIPNYVSVFENWAKKATENNIYSNYHIEFQGQKISLSEYSYEISYFDNSVDHSALDIRDLNFRVSYIPMSTNTKIRARKRASGNVEYIQPINQRAEINSASALGKFLYSTAQKTGTEQITLVKWYTKIKDIPRLGCRVKHNGEHYILTANTFEMTNCVQIKVTHTLSKNWSNKSQYVSVDQKYRNYKIPADILWRNLYWEDFIEITTDGAVAEAVPGSLISSVISEGKTLTPILPRIFMCDSTNDVTITSFFICKSSDGTGATAPCTTMGMANSMIFSASMKDNLSAGLQIDPENSDYCKEVFYCNENGTLNNAYIVLSTGIQNQDSEKYPAASLLTYGDYNNPQDTIFLHEYHIDKDKGEALKFTYQCHWTSREDNIVIGSKLAENHPLIKEWTEDRKFKFWVLKQPLRQGTDKVYANASESVLITTDYERKLNYFGIGDIATPTTVKAFKVELLGIALAAVKRSETKAWAITDENNNLYVGCNDTAKTVLYFTHIHKRK